MTHSRCFSGIRCPSFIHTQISCDSPKVGTRGKRNADERMSSNPSFMVAQVSAVKSQHAGETVYAEFDDEMLTMEQNIVLKRM